MSTQWRKAKSLVKLDSEIEEHYPGTTIWDIGDASHQSGWSDHNPSECCDVVCADDIKSDGGLNKQAFVDHLLSDTHPSLRYVIYNRKIYQRKNGFAAEDYHGVNAHTEHVHVSVGNGPDGRSTSGYDSADSWHIADIGKEPSKPTPAEPSAPATDWTQELIMALPTLKRGSEGRRVRILQAVLKAWGWKVTVDGIFGTRTAKAVREFQNKHDLTADEVVGRRTWTKLLGE